MVRVISCKTRTSQPSAAGGANQRLLTVDNGGRGPVIIATHKGGNYDRPPSAGASLRLHKPADSFVSQPASNWVTGQNTFGLNGQTDAFQKYSKESPVAGNG